jgi:hypothetical protein
VKKISSTNPNYSMQQVFPWLHLLVLFHNGLVMVTILVFQVCPSSCESDCICWIHEPSLFLAKLHEVLDTFCLPCVEDTHGMPAVLEQC